MSSVATTATISFEERQMVLERMVATKTAQGWRVASQTQTQAQLVKGKPTSHVLHLILSIVTVGLWIPVWILVAIFAGEKHQLITVDEHGMVRTTS